MSEIAFDGVPVSTPEPAAAERFRWGPLALCSACLFVEGYDGQFMGYVVPGIASDWHIAPGALGPALGAGLFGLMLGAFFIAPLADAFGRKRVVLWSVLIFGLLTVGTVFVHTLAALAVMRFLTGIGLGGAMPNTIALTAEFSPKSWRASAVTINFVSFSLGAAVGGLITADLMPAYGWGSVFLACGGMAIALVPLLIFAMPESYRPEHTAGIPIADLFRDNRASVTALLWFLFFLNLMELYFLTSWLPTIVRSQGISLVSAVQATTLVQFGGILGALLLGPLVDRFGPRFVLGVTFAAGAAGVVIIGHAGASIPVTFVAAILCGIGTVGAQNCNNGVAAKFYPAHIRATGVGWALAVGRIGSIVGPVVGGILLQSGIANRTLFLVAAVPPICAALTYISMGRQPALRGTRA